jgi:multiple inositol-polyphosphate phosphatase / 2,3-bisphosphoglycerate 3-phosphatase
MNYRNSLLIILSLIACLTCANAQVRVGTKTPYKPAQKTYTLAPAGYKPVFVNYVGRHGARFLTKAGADIKVQSLLSQAPLTPLGSQILQMTRRFLTIEDHNYENITLLGAREQAGIGARMLKQYSTAFTGRGLDVQVTHKVRTKQSANAFLTAFKSYSGTQNIHAAPVDTEENVLRFYDLSPAYLAFKNSAALTAREDTLEQDSRSLQVAKKLWAKLFKNSYPWQASAGWELAQNLYDLYSVQFSIPLEMRAKGYTRDSINFGAAFDQASLQWLGFINSAADFYEKGPGLDTSGIQITVAAPLLVDFLNTTAAVINSSLKQDAILRFTHAEAISPFATLLDIPSASHAAPSVYNYAKHWQASDIIPLSANIQWILYTNGKDYLVKVLLNEKEVRLPLKTTHAPYYKWADVQKYYTEKLHTMGADPAADMHRYLLGLQ